MSGNEEVAAFAAAGEAEMTGKPCGLRGPPAVPGNLHLINGLFDAASQPCSRAGDRGADSVGRDRRRLFPGNPSAKLVSANCSHYCELVSDPSQPPVCVGECRSVAAVGLRGVAVIAMPGDVAFRTPPKRAQSTARGLCAVVADGRAASRRAEGARGSPQWCRAHHGCSAAAAVPVRMRR